jgi:peptidoglycan/LPS O-acetylase OafA/YrhL
MSPAGLSWRPDVEGLRALAVILVVCYHAGVGALGGGFIGVDVFLVVSGFLMTSLLLREFSLTGTVSVPRFFARRAVRLLPAACTVIAATVIAAWAWLPPTRFGDAVTDSVASLFYVMNLRLAAEGSDYLGAAATSSPLMHFWSLGVEEQFYLLWPLVLLYLARRQRPLIPLALLLFGSLAASVWLSGHHAVWAYYGLHTRLWELATGAMVAMTAHRWARLGRRTSKALRWLGLAGIVTAAVSFGSETLFPGYAAMLPVFATALVIGAGCASPESRMFRTRPVQWLGKLSYSWYLWHWPTLYFATLQLDRLTVAGRLGCAAGSLALAALTYALVENPLRRRASLRVSAHRGLGLGLGLSGLVAGFALALPAPVIRADLPTVAALELGSAGDAEGALMTALAANVSHAPANLVPALGKAATDYARIYRDGCSSSFTDPAVRKPCLYGDRASATTVVLFGDSHAGQWFPALEALAAQRGWRLAVVIKSACSPAWVTVRQPRLNRPYHECARWREAATAYIRSLHPAMVVMSGADDGQALDAGPRQDETWASGWQETFARLASPGTRQILILDTAWPSADVPACVSANPTQVTSCARTPAEAIANPARRHLIASAARATAVSVIDPVPWMCHAAACPAIVGNLLVYHDASHLTASYARLLAPLLAPRLT